jgi:hypothetical protein
MYYPFNQKVPTVLCSLDYINVLNNKSYTLLSMYIDGLTMASPSYCRQRYKTELIVFPHSGQTI